MRTCRAELQVFDPFLQPITYLVHQVDCLVVCGVAPYRMYLAESSQKQV
jgi:hypothetical protein